MNINSNGLLRSFLFQVTTPIRFAKGSTHVDLGAGDIPRNPFQAEFLIATDFQEPENFKKSHQRVQCDLTLDMPFADNSIDSFSAFDVLEHIPRWERREGEIKFPFIHLMNEIYRCLKPNGLFIAVTPAFPHPASFQDPTHVNVITIKTAEYFCGKEASARTLGYGFNGYFEEIQNAWLRGPGPFENASWFSEEATSFLINRRIGLEKSQILRFIVRVGRVLRRRNSSHIIWVFRKLPPPKTEAV